MKHTEIINRNPGSSGSRKHHEREYFSGIAVLKSDAAVINDMIRQALDKLRKTLRQGWSSLKHLLAGPIKPLNEVFIRKSNLLHDYYAVNSIDGMNWLQPVPAR